MENGVEGEKSKTRESCSEFIAAFQVRDGNDWVEDAGGRFVEKWVSSDMSLEVESKGPGDREAGVKGNSGSWFE